MSRPRFNVQQSLAIWMIVAVLLRVVAWWTGTRVLPPSSDESIAMLMAQDISRGEWPLLFWAQPYLFPLESYLMAPFSWLPPTAGSWRLLPLLMGLVATWLSFKLVSVHTAPRTGDWFAHLLVAVPSTYVIILQGFYAPPGYPTLLLTCALLPYLVHRCLATGRARWAVAAGFTASLAFTAHSLSLCIVLPALIVLFLGKPAGWWKRGLAMLGGLMAGAGGLLVGALPYLLARILIRGAHALADDRRSLLETIERCWSPTLTHALPGAMGFRPVPFPDTKAGAFLLPISGNVFAVAIVILLAGLVLWRAARIFQAIREKRWPDLQTADILLAGVLGNIVLFATTPRSDSSSYRYLAPAALMFPILIASAWVATRNAWRVPFLLAGIAITLSQLLSMPALIREWRTPDFATRMGVPDLQPALSELDRLGIRHAVASYGAAYRITYESGGRITAAQPYNERFPQWPLPAKERVDAAPDAAYVLTESIRFLKPAVFERHLRIMDVTAQVTTCGAFRVYHRFQGNEDRPVLPVPVDDLQASACVEAEVDRLIDGRRDSSWRTRRAQQPGDWVEVTWYPQRALESATLVYGNNKDMARSTRLFLRVDGVWMERPELLDGTLDKFEFRNGRPIYGHDVRRVSLAGQLADGIRFQVVEPNPGRDWTVAEIEITERVPAPGAPDLNKP